MGLQDLIITPIYFFLLLIAAFAIRPLVTNSLTKKYFIPGLMVKSVGAIALGLVYQFYYGGGDTFTFHTHGSRWIWQAFLDEPSLGLELFFTQAGDYDGNLYQYSSRIWMFRDAASWFIIKIAAFFDLFTFGTYGCTALFFAAFAFSGHWALYTTLQKIYPSLHKHLALACLFIPSVIFWGSGILKDSITLSALCWMMYFLLQLTHFQKLSIISVILFILMGWVLYSIKIYILLCFLIAASIYMYFKYVSIIKNLIVKLVAAPLLITVFIGGGYFVMNQIAASDSRYALDKIAQTAMITAYDIRYGWGARGGDNSGYTLGELDGSIGSLISLAPQGVIVTLFRPWLWEVRNPLMLLAALESLFFLTVTINLLFKFRRKVARGKVFDPIVIFCLGFSLLFAFAVGVSTYNFGTLMRYKIPVMPFYALSLVLFYSKLKIK